MWLALASIYGFVISVPPTGPVALLVLERALQRAYGPALALALGSTLADLPYIALGALGYAELVQRSPGLADALEVATAVLLGLLAARVAWGSPPSEPMRRTSRKGAVLTGLLLGLANPTRLVTWALVASLVGEGPSERGAMGLAAYTLAVTAGQILWWMTLMALLQRAGGILTERARERLRQGTALAAFGLAVVLIVRALA